MARDVIFGLRDLNDNPDLQRTAGRLLAMITSITPSLELIEPLMQGLISILQDAPVSFTFFFRLLASAERQLWKTKTHCMPVLSLVYYRNLSLLSETCKAKALDVSDCCTACFSTSSQLKHVQPHSIPLRPLHLGTF